VEVNPYGPVKGSVNYYAAQKDGKLMIHLLNFTDATHLDWRDDARSQKEPAQIGSFTISIRSGRTVSRVWAASPDIDGGVPKMVDYKADGASISVTVPSLKYWTMIVVE
jgi:dextranase